MLTDCSPIDSIFGSQYRWLSEGQEIVSDVTVGRFYQILNLPCCEMRDIVYFHAHTGPSMELRSPRTRQNRPKSQNGGPYKGHPETGEHNYKRVESKRASGSPRSPTASVSYR